MKPARIEVLITGEELLDGRVLNTNEHEIVTALAQHGLSVDRITITGDQAEELKALVQAMSTRADIVIMSGGLGPTSDDHTRSILAQAAQVKLKKDAAVLQKIRDFHTKRGRTINDIALQQAAYPESARLIPNEYGMAPGLDLQIGRCRFLALPGVPDELKPMLVNYIIPELRASLGLTSKPITRIYKCFGLGEGQIQEKLNSIYSQLAPLYLGYQIKLPEVHILLRSSENTPILRKHFAKIDRLIKKALTPHLYGCDEADFITVLSNHLIKKGRTLALAESCTGGLIAHLLTAQAGASRFLLYSGVVYSNESKIKTLGIQETTITKYGAVSSETALEMARQVQKITGADYGLAITGIAGPDGGSQTKPVGTIHLACATKDQVWQHQILIPGSRTRVQLAAAYEALQLLSQASQ